MRQKRTLLWQNITLPPWNPQLLYKLFMRHKAGETPTPAEREAYARQLMVYIAANLGRTKWFATLRRCQLDPDDVTANILFFLIQKTPNIVLAVPCIQVLLKVLNVAVFHRLASEIRQRKFTDELPRYSEEDDLPARQPISRESPVVGQFERAMRDAENIICRGNWSDQISICVLYRFMCRQIVRRNTILTYNQLPARLGKRISLEQHGTISYRLNKFVSESAYL